jgi:predicted acetyltransferase
MEQYIRMIKDNEAIEESLRLSEFAFQYELSPEERQDRLAHFKPEMNWGYYVDNRLAAKLTILTLQTWINGQHFSVGGIAGVATWPEYRRHGMVRKLLIHALQTMRDQGQTISLLHPFQYAFYRKFGWETFTEFKKYEVETKLLPAWSDIVGHIKRTSDWRLLDPIYQTYASGFNGMLIRDEDWWIRRVFKAKSGTAAIYYDDSGAAQGYIYYKVINKEMTVHELVFLNEQARKGLWKFISDHDSMLDRVLLKAPSNDKLPFLLSNPRIKQELEPYMMARIVDLVPFLEQYTFAAGLEKRKFELQITDAQASWNNGIFSVKVDSGGKAKVKRVEADELKKTKRLSTQAVCDIGTLTALLIGYQRPAFLQSIGRLEADAAVVADLDALLPQRTTYMADFF